MSYLIGVTLHVALHVNLYHAFTCCLYAVLEAGMRTGDIKDKDGPAVSTSEMGDAIVAEIKKGSC